MKFSDKGVMTDEDAISYLDQKIKSAEFSENFMVQNGKVLINGRAFRKMLLFGPPTYYIAWRKDCVIYDFAYSELELLESCRNVMRLVREHEPSEVGFSYINGEQLYACSIEKWKPEMVKETINYPFGYRE